MESKDQRGVASKGALKEPESVHGSPQSTPDVTWDLDRLQEALSSDPEQEEVALIRRLLRPGARPITVRRLRPSKFSRSIRSWTILATAGLTFTLSFMVLLQVGSAPAERSHSASSIQEESIPEAGGPLDNATVPPLPTPTAPRSPEVPPGGAGPLPWLNP